MNEVSRRVRTAEAAFAPVADFYFRSRYADRRFQKGVADFTFGNPQEMPLDGLVSALRDSERSCSRQDNGSATSRCRR